LPAGRQAPVAEEHEVAAAHRAPGTPDVPVSEIPVVILCGGMGTRLREVTESIPKPLVDIGEKPILWHIMKLYDHYGFRRFVLCLGYKSWDIKEYFLRYREHRSDFTISLRGEHELEFHNRLGDEDWQITCAETGLLTGTGGRLHRVQHYIDTPQFMFTYGDGIGDVAIDDLLQFHRGEGRLATVTGVRPTSRYGELRASGTAVSEFAEKPTKAEGLVSGGFFVLQRDFLSYLTDAPDLLFEREPLQKAARDGQLSVFVHEGFWMGMDTYREYSTLNDLWARDVAPWKVW
jgi:glucose-1-phosphate cytidylyltransferase